MRIAHKMALTVIVRPSAAAAASPRRNPAVTAATTASSASPALLMQLGSEPAPRRRRRRRRRDRPPPRRRHGRSCSSVCITASVCSNVARYCSRSLAAAPAVNQACSSAGSVWGSVHPISSASSITVSTRSPPSRWSCNSTFGTASRRSEVATSMLALAVHHAVGGGRPQALAGEHEHEQHDHVRHRVGEPVGRRLGAWRTR